MPVSRYLPAPPRNRWSVTPSSFIALVISLLRCWPRPSCLSEARCASSGTRISPSSPRVQVTSVTEAPAATYFAIVAPWPMVSSSGCACTSISRWSMRVRLVRAAQQQLADLCDERDVRRQPGDRVELVGTQPHHGVVLEGRRLAGHQLGAQHLQRVAVADLLVPGEGAGHAHHAAELFAYLPDHGVFRLLPRLNLAAGQLPETARFRWRGATRGEDPTLPHDRG